MGMAPATARSLTVPLTARSPIEPPGNRSGLTTKLSVVMAIETSSTVSVAASPSDPHAPTSGAISPSTRRRLAVPPAPCAISICVSVKRRALGNAIVDISHRRRRSAVHVAEVGGTGAFRGHHERTDRAFRRALATEQLALMRFENAFEDLATLRGFRIGDLHARHRETDLCIPRRVSGAKLQRRLRDEAEAPPFEVGAELEHIREHAQRRYIAVPRHNAAVLVFDLGPAITHLPENHHNRLQKIERLEP